MATHNEYGGSLYIHLLLKLPLEIGNMIWEMAANLPLLLASTSLWGSGTYQRKGEASRDI
jgi:hypothetical protein